MKGPFGAFKWSAAKARTDEIHKYTCLESETRKITVPSMRNSEHRERHTPFAIPAGFVRDGQLPGNLRAFASFVFLYFETCWVLFLR
jgi:hypothetical protein